jgi:hypothetical protein
MPLRLGRQQGEEEVFLREPPVSLHLFRAVCLRALGQLVLEKNMRGENKKRRGGTRDRERVWGAALALVPACSLFCVCLLFLCKEFRLMALCVVVVVVVVVVVLWAGGLCCARSEWGCLVKHLHHL